MAEDIVLRIDALIWAKIRYLRDMADTEISGWGILDAEDPLHVIGFEMVKQVCTPAETEMDDEALNDWVDKMVTEKGYQPWQLQRVWIHTHPGFGSTPSGTDDKTFAEIFEHSDWGIMMIVGDTSNTCQLKVKTAQPCELVVEEDVKLVVSWEGMIDPEELQGQLDEMVTKKSDIVTTSTARHMGFGAYNYYGGRGYKTTVKDNSEKLFGAAGAKQEAEELAEVDDTKPANHAASCMCNLCQGDEVPDVVGVDGSRGDTLDEMYLDRLRNEDLEDLIPNADYAEELGEARILLGVQSVDERDPKTDVTPREFVLLRGLGHKYSDICQFGLTLLETWEADMLDSEDIVKAELAANKGKVGPGRPPIPKGDKADA